METIRSFILHNSPKTVTDYLRISRQLMGKINNQTDNNPKIRIALLSSFTIQPLPEILSVKCWEDGIAPSIYTAPYNQYTQEILDENSSLYTFMPDIIVLFIDLRALLGDYFFSPYQIDDNERKSLILEKLDQLYLLVNTLSQNSSAKVILHNFEMPGYSPMGILEQKQEFGIYEAIEFLNYRLRQVWKASSQVYLFDYLSWCTYYGQHNLFDPKLYYLGDIKLNFEFMPALCDDYLGFIKPLVEKFTKCIVLDLDNTLWGGVLGEDGMEGIHLGLTPEGRPFWEFQKFLLAQYHRGIILAINSKNNIHEVKHVFTQHPYMILREEHFAAERINWLDKADNLRSLAIELNIGLDSMVFIDDDPLNREIVKGALPEVMVVDLPEDPALYLSNVQHLNIWNVLSITTEDLQKGEIYNAQRQRQELKESSTNVEEYLRGLEITASIIPCNSFTIPRIAQLTQKTNQFNMTTRRYDEGKIKDLAKNSQYLIVAVQVKDKFGDNGITGLVIVEKGKRRWRIDNLLLSCRVIGRKIEVVLLAYVLDQARQSGVSVIEGEFISTEKNMPAQDFYSSYGFKKVETNDSRQFWELDVNNDIVYPHFIQIILE